MVIIGLGYIFGWFFLNDPLGIAILAFLFSLAYAGTSYFFADKVVLAVSGAKQIRKEDEPQLYRTVENLCIGAGLPMPKLYVMEERAMNAFATGRDPSHAVVVVTRGLLDNLKGDELEGVLAHELSHVRNYDIRIATFAAVLAGIIVIIADIFLRSMFWGGGNRERREGGTLILLIGLVLVILSPIVAQLIQLAISRQREYLADSSGALLTRYPEGLALALEKIGADKTPLRHVSNATAHLYIANPLGSGFVANLFSTHPPIEERIKRLREI